MLLRAGFLVGELLLSPQRAATRNDISVMPIRIRLWDCDTNGHVNNARYLSLLDWARFKLFVEQDLWSLMGKRYYPIVQSLEVSYIKSVLPHDLCVIQSQILSWDDKYLYIDHQFYVKEQLCTHARCRVAVFEGRQQRQALLRLLATPPKRPESLDLWTSYLNKKKSETGAHLSS